MPRFFPFFHILVPPHILFVSTSKKTTAEIVDNKKCITANVTKRHSINFYMLNIIWQTFYFSPLEICMHGKLPMNVLTNVWNKDGKNLRGVAYKRFLILVTSKLSKYLYQDDRDQTTVILLTDLFYTWLSFVVVTVLYTVCEQK